MHHQTEASSDFSLASARPAGNHREPEGDPATTTVSLVGAGPGDPELLTRKAWRILGEADVVLYDALLDAPGMRSAAPQALWLSVGKRAGQPSVDQAFICRSMVEYARQGMKVVRLKGGDPSLFGRAAEELSACREAGIRVEIVPGVTSACAAAADLQASLTLRGVSRSVAFVTPRLARGEHEESEWLAVSLAAQTVVIYMGGAHIQSVCQRLIAGGKPALTPVCVVENASGPGARVASTLLNLARSGMPHMTGPVSMLVGDALAQAVIPNEAAIPAAHAAQLR